jgi:hypothetical protein
VSGVTDVDVHDEALLVALFINDDQGDQLPKKRAGVKIGLNSF